MTARQARERQRVVAYLISSNPMHPERTFSLPLAPADAVRLSAGAARRRLEAIHEILRSCECAKVFLHDPVFYARTAISAKILKRPADLEGSAKLYRAICDLELAMTLPSHAAQLDVIEAAVDELRRLTGWTPED